MDTPQDQMKAKLESLGLAYKEIKCYGRQIMVTSHSESTAKRWASILSQFATVRPPCPSVQHAKVNKNTVMKPSTIKVWLTWASV